MEVKTLVDKMVYRDLRTTLDTTEDDDCTEKPFDFLGASSDVVATKDSGADEGAGSGVSMSQDNGSDGKKLGLGPDGDAQRKRAWYRRSTARETGGVPHDVVFRLREVNQTP